MSGVLGNRPVSQRPYKCCDDILSLGLVLAEVMGFWRPSEGMDTEAALHQLKEEVPESMRAALKKHLEQQYHTLEVPIPWCLTPLTILISRRSYVRHSIR